MSNVWKTLSAIDCGQHIEKKGNLSYLSWSWAWSTLMAHYPASEFQIHADEIHADGSVTVHCAVTVEGLTRKMWLPVMDHKNNSIKNPDSRKISDAKMRCLVKCIALFGLGLYIYAGEDLPQAAQEEMNKPITEEQFVELNKALDETLSDKEKFCEKYKIKSLKELSQSDYEKAKTLINDKRRKMEANNAKS